MQTAAGRERWNRALDAASDAALAICLFTTFSFQHTLVSTTGMGLMLLVALVRFAVRPRFYGSVWYLGYALVIAWGAVGVLAGWAIEPATALAMCKTMCVGLGFMLVVHQLVVQRRNAEMSLLMCLLACLATMAYALIGERENLFETRVGSAVNIYPNDLAMILSIGYGIAIHRACERRRWYELIPALVLAGTVLLTGSRKGMAMLVLIPAVYLLWRDRRHLRRNLLVLAALLIALAAAVLIALLYWYFGTEQGSALRATGSNPAMSRAQGINIDRMKVIGLALSNGVVALSGGLMTQFQGTADVNMGRGAIVIGLASIVIGEVFCEAIFKKGCNFSVKLLFIVLGGVLYYMVMTLILWLRLDPNDLKLFTALIVPRWNVL